MKLAWFSPLPPDQTDIANFTVRVRGELAQRFDVRFFTERRGGFIEAATGTFYPAGSGAHPGELLVSLNTDDLPVYHLGNNAAFFVQTWLLSQLKPGLVILHDLKLHHFFNDVYHAFLHDHQSYLDTLATTYGVRGRKAGKAFCRGQVSINFMAQHFPMTAWAIQNALGVVVHTPYARDQIRQLTSTPVWTIPLPYEPRTHVDGAISHGTQQDTRITFSRVERVKLIIFGYLNTNRRVIEFLHALATLPERDFFELDIFGTIHHHREVNAAVDLLKLTDRVKMHGHVSDQQLDEALQNADLAVNLRYPTMGEASGSQMRLWDHALPSLVTYSDAYANLPPETVCFVRPEHEQHDVQGYLRHFLREPQFFRAKGRRARRWLLEHHLPTMYVEALGPICAEARALRSRHNRLALADRVGRAIAPWARPEPPGGRELFYAERIAEMV